MNEQLKWFALMLVVIAGSFWLMGACIGALDKALGG